MTESKRAYGVAHSAIGGEIRLWGDATGRWQAVHTLTLSAEAKALLAALIDELSKAP